MDYGGSNEILICLLDYPNSTSPARYCDRAWRTVLWHGEPAESDEEEKNIRLN